MQLTISPTCEQTVIFSIIPPPIKFLLVDCCMPSSLYALSVAKHTTYVPNRSCGQQQIIVLFYPLPLTQPSLNPLPCATHALSIAVQYI